MRTIESRSYASYTNKIVKAWQEVFPAVIGGAKPTPKQRLRTVLEKFEIFAGEYIQAVHQLAQEDPDQHSLIPGEETIINLSIDDQINKALDIYWAPLSQIASQYVSAPYAQALAQNQELEERIDQYLKSIRELLGKEGSQLPGILVFFDELTLIHYYPYTDVALVSLPYRIFEMADLLEIKYASIAHELGHYVYWHMADFIDLENQRKKLMDDLQDKFVDKHKEDEWLFVGPWVEEIFADFVGAWISGLSFLESGTELIKRANGLDIEKWTENDNEHVPDILRPFIACYALEKKRLVPNGETAWKDFLKSTAIPKEGLAIIVGDTHDLGVSDVFSFASNRVIRKTLEELIPPLRSVMDYLISSIQEFKQGNPSQFKFVFSVTVKPENLKARARQIVSDNKLEKNKAFEVLLQPTVIEAGQGGAKHQHNVLPSSIPHWHTYPKPISHRHT
jgi:hypothetical protein